MSRGMAENSTNNNQKAMWRCLFTVYSAECVVQGVHLRRRGSENSPATMQNSPAKFR